MRFVVNIALPHEPFNTYTKDGSAGTRIQKILDQTRPESIYFTEVDGYRHAVAIYDIDSASRIPFYAEPWFLTFDAACEFRVAMTPEDLQKSGLDDLGQTWGS